MPPTFFSYASFFAAWRSAHHHGELLDRRALQRWAAALWQAGARCGLGDVTDVAEILREQEDEQQEAQSETPSSGAHVEVVRTDTTHD